MTEQKQIEEMAEAIFKNCHCGLFFSEAEKIADFMINQQGYRKQEWISVEERLPEENTEVLIYCKTNNSKEVFFVDKIRYFRGIAIWDVWNGKVTHWMPLPMTPKGD